MLEGIIVLLLLIWIVTSFFRKAFHAVWWALMLIVLLQIGYILGQTELNNAIPFASVFKYDVIAAVAQVFPGTPVETFLMKISEFLSQIFRDFAATVSAFWDDLHLDNIWNPIRDGFMRVYSDIID